MTGPQPERPMTVIPPVVAMLREMVARWDRASEAGDLDETRSVGAELAGVVEALLAQHDADTTEDGDTP